MSGYNCGLGLGELTFLQLSTTYPLVTAGRNVGCVFPESRLYAGSQRTRYFASGTGAAGLVGAFLWWELRNLGVRTGVGLSSVSVLWTVVTHS